MTPGLPFAAAVAVAAAIAGIEEPSGVARAGDRLLVVGDDEHGVFFTLPVRGDETGLLALEPSRLARRRLRGGRAAIDLEAVDVLADGRVVVLSERAAALFDERGVVVRYGPDLAEVAGRGLEGLAVRAESDGSSRVAVLWEGGYLDPDRLPPGMRGDVVPPARRPRVLVHRLSRGARNVTLAADDVARVVELDVPLPAGREPWAQRFRAPDLVWHRLGEGVGAPDGWIVLLSSGWSERPPPGAEETCATTEDGAPLRWCHRLLQRFDAAGDRVGEPFDLDDVLPEPVRTANWEGLGWFVEGSTLVLVHDEPVTRRRTDPQQAFVMELPAGW